MTSADAMNRVPTEVKFRTDDEKSAYIRVWSFRGYSCDSMEVIEMSDDKFLMTYDEFISDVNIKNADHERIVKLTYPYYRCVCGVPDTLTKVIGRIIDVDFSNTSMLTGCLNGIFDGTEPPYENVNLYCKFDNGMRVFVYGFVLSDMHKNLKNNEYILINLSDNLNDRIEIHPDRHIYMYPTA